MRNSMLGIGRRRKGAMVPLLCVLLPAALALVALFIGVSQMQYARSQMRLAADAAARAATEAVLRTDDRNAAFRHAAAIAANHDVMGEEVVLGRDDVVFGRATSIAGGEWVFSPNQRPFNATQVDILKNRESRSGVVRTLLPGFGPSFFETAQSATAAQIDHDVVIVIEAGGSMHAPGRWDGVMKGMEDIVSIVPDLPNRIQLGLVECHNEPTVKMDLSGQGDDLLASLQRLHDQASNTKLM